MTFWKSWENRENSRRLLLAAILLTLFTGISWATAEAQEAREGRLSRLFSGRRNQEQEVSETPTGSSDELLRQETLRRIPWKEMTAETRATIQPIMASPSIYRRLPDQAVYCRPELYQFMLQHPDVVVAFWEKLGATQISLTELEKDRYRLKESGGTTAVCEVVYRNPNLIVVYAKGAYRGSFIARPVEGESVTVLRTRFAVDEDDEPFVVCRLDTFVSISNTGADMIAKLLAPMIGKVADGNFEQTVGFIGSVSEAINRNPRGIHRMAGQLPHLSDQVRVDFQRLIADTMRPQREYDSPKIEPFVSVRLLDPSEIPPEERLQTAKSLASPSISARLGEDTSAKRDDSSRSTAPKDEIVDAFADLESGFSPGDLSLPEPPGRSVRFPSSPVSTLPEFPSYEMPSVLTVEKSALLDSATPSTDSLHPEAPKLPQSSASATGNTGVSGAVFKVPTLPHRNAGG